MREWLVFVFAEEMAMGVVQQMLPSASRLRFPSLYQRLTTTTCAASKVEPPNVAHLCEKARLTLTPEEVQTSLDLTAIFTSLFDVWIGTST